MIDPNSRTITTQVCTRSLCCSCLDERLDCLDEGVILHRRVDEQRQLGISGGHLATKTGLLLMNLI